MFENRRSVYTKSVGIAAVVAAVGCAENADPPTEFPSVGRNGDVVAAGAVLELPDSIPGDVMLAGRSLTFDGFAGGSYVGAAADQSVGGEVRGSVRAAGGSVDLDAAVGRNVTAAGGRVTVHRGTEIAGNTYLAGGTVRFEGTALGEVRIRAGEAVIDGTFEGPLRIDARELTIGPEANIEGGLEFRLADGAEPDVAAGADVDEPFAAMDSGGASGVGSFLFKLLAFVLTGTALVALLPTPMAGVARTLEGRPGAALGYGLLVFFAVPVIAVLVGITLIGIPMALILGGTYAASLYLAPIVPALWIGRRLLGSPDPTSRGTAVRASMIGSAVVGLGMLLPWFGVPIRVAAACAGLGSVAVAGTRS